MTDAPLPLPIPAAPPAAPAPAPPRFGAGMATVTLLLFLLAQVAAGIVIATVAMIVTIAQHGVNDAAIKHAINSAGPALILGSAVVGAAATLFAARTWAWHLVKDRTARGIGVAPLATRQLLLAIGAGIALAIVYLAVARLLIPPRAGTPLGPLMRIAVSGWAGRAAFALVAILLAPPIEEFLFRGLLLKGFAESWGLKTAAIIVSFVFILLHIPEVAHYWPALIAIIALAATTLAARLLTGSLAAAVALHASYNTAMVIAGFLAM